MSETITPIAYPIEDAPAIAGVTRTRLFDAARKGEITVRKAGRASLIERDELLRWISSLPTRGRQPSATTVPAGEAAA
jgi:hypothetical protein